MKRRIVRADEVAPGDVVHHVSPTEVVDFKVGSVRETAAGSLIRIDGRALPGQSAEGRIALSFQRHTAVEVSR